MNRISKIKVVTSDMVALSNDGGVSNLLLNGEIMGENKTKQLRSGDKIRIGSASSALFIYYDCYENEQSQYDNQLADKYIIFEKIGEGTFGEVMRAYRYVDYERCAIKMLKKNPQADLKYVKSEIELSQSIEHKNIVRMYEAKQMYETQQYFFVFENADGGQMPEKRMNEKVGDVSKHWTPFKFDL